MIFKDSDYLYFLQLPSTSSAQWPKPLRQPWVKGLVENWGLFPILEPWTCHTAGMWSPKSSLPKGEWNGVWVWHHEVQKYLLWVLVAGIHGDKAVFYSTQWLTLSKSWFAVINVVNVLTVSLQRVSVSPGPHFSTFVEKKAFFRCLPRTQPFDLDCSKAGNCTHLCWLRKQPISQGSQMRVSVLGTGRMLPCALTTLPLPPHSLTQKQSKQE